MGVLDLSGPGGQMHSFNASTLSTESTFVHYAQPLRTHAPQDPSRHRRNFR
jgi:hypothetical protein